MNNRTKITLSFFISLIISLNVQATSRDNSLEHLLDFSNPKLEKVKNAYADNDPNKALSLLLRHFRERQDIIHPTINHWQRGPVVVTPLDQSMAANGLKRLLFVHKGYGYFDYGADINWSLWPVKDNEVRFQLHRMYWWIPMAKAYWNTGDEAYVKEWKFQFRDWIADNPLVDTEVDDDPQKVTLDEDYNHRYPWRSLEVSRRLQDQAKLFNFFLSSAHFDEGFLADFLINYHRHAARLHEHYSPGKNHLLFQAMRMFIASIMFPEFKHSKQWQQRAIAILHREIDKQINNDGYHYEISPNYHVASIEIFLKAYNFAKVNGLADLFNNHYLHKVNRMIRANIVMSFPDLSVPMFGDAKWRSFDYMLSRYRTWAALFPQDKVLEYFASGFKSGQPPEFLSEALTTTGLYSFRNGWQPNSTVLLMRNGIPGGAYHSQPDNGTFELWHNGSNLMPDPGAFMYSGEEVIMKQRRWFRQSKIHNTLTLDDKRINIDAKPLFWRVTDKLESLVVENQSYPDLKHRRSIFFIEKRFFVILDEAIGAATGAVKVRHFVKEGQVSVNPERHLLRTDFAGSNLSIAAVAVSEMSSEHELSRVSYHYGKAKQRSGISLTVNKTNDYSARLISVLMPFDGPSEDLDVQLINAQFVDDRVTFTLTINQQQYQLGYQLDGDNSVGSAKN
ncbi:heparinase II/III family protein [Paraferrimonas sp. SM1919]|uniref:heparinase II/III family protein n=1 Tax=Paraferrimonas sp. SM1919 TaxID=2662263 RepID=UPI0013D758E6|nr:heparinase II/III family protein [Paraferrimonas sp. SM1919]